MKKNLGGMAKNDLFTAEITDMTNTGAGVARINGVVAFVSGAVDGDTAECRVIKVANGYLVCRAEKITVPSPYRVEGGCPVLRRCGGCAFRQVTPAHELELKEGYIRAAFAKQGIKADVRPFICGTDEKGRAIFDGWRNKAQLPVGDDGSFGYYAAHSHEIIPCGGCPLHVSRINKLSAFAESYVKREGLRGLRHFCVRSGSGGMLVCIVADAGRLEYTPFADALMDSFSDLRGVVLNINDRDTNVIYGDRFTILRGDDHIEDKLCGLRFRISTQSFYQVNRQAAERAYEKLFELSGARSGDRLLDLYCGAGTIGLYFASRLEGAPLTGVEIVAEAVENAKINAALNGIQNASFICRNASDIDISSFGADIIIVDPPRKGLTGEAVSSIIAAAPRVLAYMSCDPDTLARDVSLLTTAGYRMSEVYPVNMFPRTGHMETVCILSNLNDSRPAEVDPNIDELALTEAES